MGRYNRSLGFLDMLCVRGLAIVRNCVTCLVPHMHRDQSQSLLKLHRGKAPTPGLASFGGVVHRHIGQGSDLRGSHDDSDGLAGTGISLFDRQRTTSMDVPSWALHGSVQFKMLEDSWVHFLETHGHATPLESTLTQPYHVFGVEGQDLWGLHGVEEEGLSLFAETAFEWERAEVDSKAILDPLHDILRHHCHAWTAMDEPSRQTNDTLDCQMVGCREPCTMVCDDSLTL